MNAEADARNVVSGRRTPPTSQWRLGTQAGAPGQQRVACASNAENTWGWIGGWMDGWMDRWIDM